MSDPRHTTRLLLPVLIAAATLLAALGTVGCTGQRDRSGLLKGVPTTDIRFKAVRTGVGDFTITVPRPFVIDEEAGAESDVFLFTDTADSGDVQKGMIYLTIALKPLTFIPATAEVTTTGGSIAGESVEWTEALEITPAGEPLYQRQAIARDLFTMNPSPGTGDSYILQGFVVGTDSLLVERLMASVESVRPVPKANL